MSALPETIVSKILPVLFSQVTRRDTLNVLDLGVGLGQSMDVISPDRPCAFYFADIGRHVNASYDGSATSLLPFNVPEDTKFDVCFFWDYLNLMNHHAMEQFAVEIDPHLSRDTLIHGFVAVDVRVPMSYKRFKLTSQDSMECLEDSSYIARYPKSRLDFEQTFPSAACERAILYPGNRLELLAIIDR